MMLKFIVVMAALSASLAGCVGGRQDRYELVGAGNSCAYKMDRDSGQVWFVSPDGERKLHGIP